ncbi:MAG: hypothetical protein DRH03_04005 [Deltaproteobacteria bacterium]|nr:MAG: hypothetical protein DRH03_04005 [Deltaproteobacteria bacterium]
MRLTGKTNVFLAVVFFITLLSACAPREIKPPPRTGKIIAQFSHGAQAFDITYSVGQLDSRLKVVGTIVNTYLSDLDNFKLDLNVIASGEKVVFKVSTPVFDIKEHGSHTFVFYVPLLHGPYLLSFRYEYDYYDFAESGRRGRVSMRSDTNEWSYFEDLIELP